MSKIYFLLSENWEYAPDVFQNLYFESFEVAVREITRIVSENEYRDWSKCSLNVDKDLEFLEITENYNYKVNYWLDKADLIDS